MEWASSELLTVLRFLLPGLVSAWVFYGLTAYPRPSEFERIVQALIFTAIVQGLTLVVAWAVPAASRERGLEIIWSAGFNDVTALVIAVVFGMFAARFANNDWLHYILRASKFTQNTSYSSEWIGAFAEHQGYVVLHISGERRLYGWPDEWPNDPTTGHFSISEGEWLTENDPVLLENVENILVPVGEVSFVEFVSETGHSA